ncbi:MAG: 2-oxoacid:acceptor oxidoreductase family protein [Nitrososphaerales archaeon]|jgi:2-oxoglutarate ferredoxin oxidoreductase subunit gamma
MAGRIEIRFGGSGGQGVVLAARILGEAAVLDGRNVLQTQAYGAEARGSLTKSEVIISDGKIGFPAVRELDLLVTMSQEAANSLVKGLKETGTLIVDSSNVTNVPETKAVIHRLPITETAKKELGEGFYANMVMLGALTGITGVVTNESVEKAIRESLAEKHTEINVQAFREGLRLRPQS